jgi:hypothetical protein
MIFDNQCKVVYDPQKQQREIFNRVATRQSAGETINFCSAGTMGVFNLPTLGIAW